MDNRQFERFATSFGVRVLNQSRELPPVSGQMVDVSSGGVCVELPSEWSAGDAVRVEFAEGCLFGQVIYTRTENDTVRTGIEIFDVLLEKTGLSRLVDTASRGGLPQENLAA